MQSARVRTFQKEKCKSLAQEAHNRCEALKARAYWERTRGWRAWWSR